MNWVRAIAGILVLWSSTAWGATLTWNANSEPDLAGYRVYQCSRQPCTRSSGKASPLATLGKVTSFNIGTPAVIQYYFITAYDFANNESGESSLATYTPAGAPPPSPPPCGASDCRGRSGHRSVGRDSVHDRPTGCHGVGALRWRRAVYRKQCTLWLPDDNGSTATTGLFGTGSHTVEFVFYLQDTTTEIGRTSVTVLEGNPPPPPPVEPPAIGASPTSLSFTAYTRRREPRDPNLEHQQHGGRHAQLDCQRQCHLVDAQSGFWESGTEP